jgi:hypothetical protein
MKTNLESLIERVEKIDFNAAKFMKDNLHWMDEDVSELIECFSWDYTPQGHAYWNRISKKLGEQ